MSITVNLVTKQNTIFYSEIHKMYLQKLLYLFTFCKSITALICYQCMGCLSVKGQKTVECSPVHNFCMAMIYDSYGGQLIVDRDCVYIQHTQEYGYDLKEASKTICRGNPTWKKSCSCEFSSKDESNNWDFRHLFTAKATRQLFSVTMFVIVIFFVLY